MTENWIKPYYLDASALIKIYVEEVGRAEVRAFYHSHSNFLVTQLCFGEALGIIKNKAKHKEISQEAYFEACGDIAINAWGGRLEIEDIPLSDPVTLQAVEAISRNHGIDLSDSLQIHTILNGKHRHAGPNSAPILITADEGLAKAARSFGIRTWNCRSEPLPSWA